MFPILNKRRLYIVAQFPRVGAILWIYRKEGSRSPAVCYRSFVWRHIVSLFNSFERSFSSFRTFVRSFISSFRSFVLVVSFWFLLFYFVVNNGWTDSPRKIILERNTFARFACTKIFLYTGKYFYIQGNILICSVLLVGLQLWKSFLIGPTTSSARQWVYKGATSYMALYHRRGKLGWGKWGWLDELGLLSCVCLLSHGRVSLTISFISLRGYW